jgi:hypothetical protein
MTSNMKSDEPIRQWSAEVKKPAAEPGETRDADHGVLDPSEPRHRLPEGLERPRRGPLNKDGGRH